VFQKKLSTLSIWYIKNDKLRQAHCNEFLDNFVMKKTGQKLFNCFSVLCLALLDSMIVDFYFLIQHVFQ